MDESLKFMQLLLAIEAKSKNIDDMILEAEMLSTSRDQEETVWFEHVLKTYREMKVIALDLTGKFREFNQNEG